MSTMKADSFDDLYRGISLIIATSTALFVHQRRASGLFRPTGYTRRYLQGLRHLLESTALLR